MRATARQSPATAGCTACSTLADSATFSSGQWRRGGYKRPLHRLQSISRAAVTATVLGPNERVSRRDAPAGKGGAAAGELPRGAAVAFAVAAVELEAAMSGSNPVGGCGCEASLALLGAATPPGWAAAAPAAAASSSAAAGTTPSAS